MDFLQKVTEIQEKLQAPKKQYNSFGNFYYRSQEDILEGLKPLLKEYGLTQTITDTVRMIGDRYYVEAVVTVESQDGKHSLQTQALAREPENKKGMDGSQITGTASSYARKYALGGMWLIDDTKDADTYSNQPEQPKPKPKVKQTLNPKHEKWEKAIQSIQAGATTVEEIEKHYALSKASRLLLNAIKPKETTEETNATEG